MKPVFPSTTITAATADGNGYVYGRVEYITVSELYLTLYSQMTISNDCQVTAKAYITWLKKASRTDKSL